MDPQQVVCPVVVLLPFEMEFLMERTGVSAEAFRRWPIEIAPGVTIDIGMWDLGKPCPFLQDNFQCGIYNEKPVDCQSFPLLASLDPSGQLAWSYEEKCPSLETLNEAFAAQIRAMWEELLPVLPQTWWKLYQAADDWTGWPADEAMELDETGPGGAVIRPVIGPDSPLLPVAVELFQEIFPGYAHYVPYIRACASQTTPDHPATFDHVWVIEQNGRYIGLRVLSYIHTRNLGHDAFVGLLEPYRGRGIGGWLVRQTMAQLRRDAMRFGQPEPLGYCAEVELPREAQDEAERRERERAMAFHLKHGGIPLPVDYYEPPMINGVSYIRPEQLTGLQSEPMQLVFYPMQPGRSLGQADLVEVVETLYLDVYRLERDSWQFRQAVSSILGRRDQTSIRGGDDE